MTSAEIAIIDTYLAYIREGITGDTYTCKQVAEKLMRKHMRKSTGFTPCTDEKLHSALKAARRILTAVEGGPRAIELAAQLSEATDVTEPFSDATVDNILRLEATTMAALQKSLEAAEKEKTAGILREANFVKREAASVKREAALVKALAESAKKTTEAEKEAELCNYAYDKLVSGLAEVSIKDDVKAAAKAPPPVAPVAIKAPPPVAPVAIKAPPPVAPVAIEAQAAVNSSLALVLWRKRGVDDGEDDSNKRVRYPALPAPPLVDQAALAKAVALAKAAAARAIKRIADSKIPVTIPTSRSEMNGFLKPRLMDILRVSMGRKLTKEEGKLSRDALKAMIAERHFLA